MMTKDQRLCMAGVCCNDTLHQDGTRSQTEARDILSVLKRKELSKEYTRIQKDYVSSLFSSKEEKLESLPRLLSCYSAYTEDDNSLTSSDHSDDTLATWGQGKRYNIVKFLFDVVDYYGEDREIVSLTMNYLDRFLLLRTDYLTDENDNKVEREYCSTTLDLEALACLGLAIKLFSPCSGCPKRGRYLSEVFYSKLQQSESHYPNHYLMCGEKNKINNDVVAGLPSMAYNGRDFKTLLLISRGFFTAKQIARVEQEVLIALDYYVHPPTSFAFIVHFLALIPPTPTTGTGERKNQSTPSKTIEHSLMYHSVLGVAYYQAELATCDERMALCKPSIIAIAAIKNAVNRFLQVCPLEGEGDDNISQSFYANSTKIAKNLFSGIENIMNATIEDEDIITIQLTLLEHMAHLMDEVSTETHEEKEKVTAANAIRCTVEAASLIEISSIACSTRTSNQTSCTTSASQDTYPLPLPQSECPEQRLGSVSIPLVFEGEKNSSLSSVSPFSFVDFFCKLCPAERMTNNDPVGVQVLGDVQSPSLKVVRRRSGNHYNQGSTQSYDHEASLPASQHCDPEIHHFQQSKRVRRSVAAL